ncbi:MAG TPA: ATP-binding protein, partial [Pseudonocardiaceae bacterium]|nr:ATP-binding protein [Pseudonocardiaceae bacterium]
MSVGDTTPDRYLVHEIVSSGARGLGLLRARIEASLPRTDSDIIADVQLVATELVTNAFLHGTPPIRFGLLAAAGDLPLRVEVSDSGESLPHVRHPGADTPHGRGL